MIRKEEQQKIGKDGLNQQISGNKTDKTDEEVVDVSALTKVTPYCTREGFELIRSTI